MRRTELADHPLVGPINPAGVIIHSQRQKRCICERQTVWSGGLHRDGEAPSHSYLALKFSTAGDGLCGSKLDNTEKYIKDKSQLTSPS